MARIYSKWVLKCLFLIIIVGYELPPKATAQLSNFPTFSKHILIQPRFYHEREKREIVTTKLEDGNHAEYLIMNYNDDYRSYVVDLKLNKHLVTNGYTMKYQENGKYVVKNNSIQDIEFCYYQGKIRGIPDSWVALSTCTDDGLSGIIYNGYENHYFEKALDENGEHLSGFNFLYKQSDLIDTKKNQSSKEHTRKRKYKRSYEESRQVIGPYNANKQSRYIELLVVVDHEWFLFYGRKLVVIELNVLDMVNTLNALFSPLNIYITLADIVVWTERIELEYSDNIYDDLLKFFRYRQDRLVQYPNDFSVLLMFNNGSADPELRSFTVPGEMCTSTSSGCVVIGGYTFVTTLHIARRIGMSLGIRYDGHHCICPVENCIMSRKNFNYATYWSSCSFQDLNHSYERGIDYCLRNKPDDETRYNDHICGNGIVDSGEQCDCGLPNGCKNSCCNAATCRFYNNATCATGECCDLNNCKLKKAGTVCRFADYECDLPEYCTGKSEYCPADVFKMDTLPCAGGKSYCYQGSCRTRSDQCKLLWGETGKPSSDECYSLNTKGSLKGSCGYNKLNMTYSKCSSENILCGMVHCESLDDKLKIGPIFGPDALCRFIYTENGREMCCTAKLDFGYTEIDPGMVPDGSICGESKMCVNQTCMEIAELRAAAKTCANNCNGNGICNNFGHCHCNFGFAPPLCKHYGYGGSEDSGPTIDLNSAMIPNRPFYLIFQLAKQWHESTKIIALRAVP